MPWWDLGSLSRLKIFSGASQVGGFMDVYHFSFLGVCWNAYFKSILVKTLSVCFFFFFLLCVYYNVKVFHGSLCVILLVEEKGLVWTDGY